MGRFPGNIYFYDNSIKRVGRSLFINRAKWISETIPFPWPYLSFHIFKTHMKDCTNDLIIPAPNNANMRNDDEKNFLLQLVLDLSPEISLQIIF